MKEQSEDTGMVRILIEMVKAIDTKMKVQTEKLVAALEVAENRSSDEEK
jgi:hypothetical protein